MANSSDPVSNTDGGQPETGTGAAGCLLRLFWMLGGNGVLLFTAFFIGDRPAPFLSLTWRDAVYWATVAALAAARSLDILKMNGQTATGSPASPAHLRRYLAILAVGAAAAWCLAHGVAALRA